MRLLLGFALIWLMGTSVLGTVFASVSPRFYGKLLPGVDPDAPLMAWVALVMRIAPPKVDMTHPC